MSSKRRKKNGFLVQGGLLAAASLIVRFIGMVYRIPMANILGEQGNGIYGLAFEIYDIVLIISTYSMPLALSKIISTQNANHQYRNMGKTFKLASVFAFISGGFFALLLFFGADFIESLYPKYPGVSIPLRVLAPTIFIVGFLGVIRGFFQGKRTMMPTAVSQIIEQVVNAFVSVYAAYAFLHAHTGSQNQAAWGAAGGTLGTCLGALAGLLFMIFIYMLYRPVKQKKERTDSHRNVLPTKDIYLILFATIIPIIISQTVYQISGIIDYYIFGNIMGARGVSGEVVSSYVGIYSSKYRTLCSVPIAISTAMASSMMPSAAASFAEGRLDKVKDKISSAVKFNMIIGFPCAVGLGVLGQPIIKLLFPSSDYVFGGYIMLAGFAAIIFYALSNVTGGALQSIDKMRTPVIHSAISLLAHIVIVTALLKFTNVGIFALVIGNVTFPIGVFALNFYALKKYIGYKQEIIKTILTPMSASLWMAIVVFLLYWGLGYLLPSNIIRVILSVIVGAGVYFVIFFFLRGISKEELLEMPMGLRIYKLANRMRLME